MIINGGMMVVKKLVFLLSVIVFITQASYTNDSLQQVDNTLINKVKITKNKIYNYGKEFFKIGLGALICAHTISTLSLKESVENLTIYVDTNSINSDVRNGLFTGKKSNFIKVFIPQNVHQVRHDLIQNLTISAFISGCVGIGLIVKGCEGIRTEWAKK